MCFSRNFDEIISSFAELLLENPPLSESLSCLFDEDICKVTALDVTGLSKESSFCSHLSKCLFCPQQNTKENPIHIINVSIKSADTEDDDALVTAFTAFAQSKVGPPCSFKLRQIDPYEEPGIFSFVIIVLKMDWLIELLILQKSVLFEFGIRRITFLVAQKVMHRCAAADPTSTQCDLTHKSFPLITPFLNYNFSFFSPFFSLKAIHGV